MSEKITVILARANWCGHCQHFEPIYEESEKKYKDNKYLQNYTIKFDNFDLANDDVKNGFMLGHYNAMEKISGYPTVLVNITDEKNKKNNYHIIEHTLIDEKINDKNKQIIEASERFLNNISNVLKSLNSDGSILYVQTGGAMVNYQTSMQEELYRKKYLKYKSKYIELKK